MIIKPFGLLRPQNIGTGYVYPANALYTQAEADDLITNNNYIPIATASELDALRTTTTQTMGLGTTWEGIYLTGTDKKYLVVNQIDLSAYSDFDQFNVWSGIFDGNLLQISNFYQSTDNGMFSCQQTTGARILRNIFLIGENYSTLQGTALIAGILGAGYLLEKSIVSGTVYQANTGERVGGLVGDLLGTLRQCISNVNSESDDRRVGSAVGIIQSGGVAENCYSTGTAISVNGQTGGFCGFNIGGTIINCYSTGVSSHEGFVGASTGIETSCYWDVTNSGNLTDGGGATGKTTTEMQAGLIPDTTIYVGWDNTIWDSIDTSNYPELIIFI